MMKLKNLVENLALARHVLQHYPHDMDTLDSTLKYFRISSNAVYPYRSSSTLHFLRLAPVEEKRLDHVSAEIRFIQYLRTNGYSAMKPVSDLQGRFAFQLDTPWGAYCVSAFEGVPGKPIEDSPASPELIRAYGRALGQLHAHSARYAQAASRPAWNEAVSRQMLQDAGAPDAILAAYDEVCRELSALPVTHDCYGLIHYDFEPDNVFFDEHSGVLSVIDFDDCICGWYAMDVEQALDCLGELSPDDLSADFLAGYRSAFPFPPENERLLPLMRRYIDLRSYMRLKHCLSEKVSDPPEWMQGLRSHLEDRLHSLEAAILR